MLPKNIPNWIVENKRPIKRNGDTYIKVINNLYSACKEAVIKEYVITTEEAKKVLDEIAVRKDTPFYKYYSSFIGTDAINENADLLYDLDEIYEDYKNPFWSRYNEIGTRFLQLSSIEGESSYFYDKQTDAIYEVDWGKMDDFIAGKLKPLFTSFYDFLEWYYSEEN